MAWLREQLLQQARVVVSALWRHLDRDKSNTIDRKEFGAGLAAAGLFCTPPTYALLFRAVDTNGDKMITRDELEAVIDPEGARVRQRKSDIACVALRAPVVVRQRQPLRSHVP